MTSLFLNLKFGFR